MDPETIKPTLSRAVPDLIVYLNHDGRELMVYEVDSDCQALKCCTINGWFCRASPGRGVQSMRDMVVHLRAM